MTTTTATTVVQVPYPQQPGVAPGYHGGYHAGYSPVPVQPQPGMPAAPYPTQYPPPYPTQPAGPPAYHETMAGKETTWNYEFSFLRWPGDQKRKHSVISCSGLLMQALLTTIVAFL